jgi:hypothetical protein
MGEDVEGIDVGLIGKIVGELDNTVTVSVQYYDLGVDGQVGEKELILRNGTVDYDQGTHNFSFGIERMKAAWRQFVAHKNKTRMMPTK